MRRAARTAAIALVLCSCSLQKGGRAGDDAATDDAPTDLWLDSLPDADPDAPLDADPDGDALDAPDPSDVPAEDAAEEEPAPPTWLGDWASRIPLVLDHNDVPDNLVDFPFLLHLSASSGREPDDVSFVFDALSADALRKRIAVTRSDGATQCAVEIESWDSAGREAWLWVNAPFVAYNTDTVLYLYYDPAQPENTSFVGDTNEPAAEIVWNANYVGVWHLAEGTGSNAFDSTLFNNHGDLNRTNHWIDAGRIDGAYDFDGGHDWAYCGDRPSLRPTTGLSVEAWVNVGAYGAWHAAVAQQWDNGGEESGYWLGSQNADGPLVFWVNTALGGWATTAHAVATGEWHHVAGTYDGTSVRLYVDAIERASSGASGPVDYDPLPYGLYLGRYLDSDEDFTMDVVLDEVRVSEVARSPAWVRASFESQIDNFVDFGAVETY